MCTSLEQAENHMYMKINTVLIVGVLIYMQSTYMHVYTALDTLKSTFM